MIIDMHKTVRDVGGYYSEVRAQWVLPRNQDGFYNFYTLEDAYFHVMSKLLETKTVTSIVAEAKCTRPDREWYPTSNGPICVAGSVEKETKQNNG